MIYWNEIVNAHKMYTHGESISHWLYVAIVFYFAVAIQRRSALCTGRYTNYELQSENAIFFLSVFFFFWYEFIWFRRSFRYNWETEHNYLHSNLIFLHTLKFEKVIKLVLQKTLIDLFILHALNIHLVQTWHTNCLS